MTEDGSCLADDTGTSGAGDGDGDGDGDGEGDGDGDTGADPECGDGQVDADEACDDGNLVDDDECTNACALPICGDGIVQASAGEICDDGNTIAGDGCTKCESSGTVVWSGVYEVEACYGRKVGVQSSGHIIATAMCDNSTWRLIGFDAEGEQLWKYGTTVAGTAMAIGADDQIAVAGQLGPTQGQIRSYDENGNYVWSRNGQADTSFRGVAFDADGSVIISGAIGADPDVHELLRRYNAVGDIVSSQEPLGNDLTAIAVDSTGSILALQSDPLRVEAFTSEGTLQSSSGVLGSPTRWGDLALDASDNSFVVAPTNAGLSFFVTKLDSAGALQWTSPHPLRPDIHEYGYGIVGLPNGGALVAGMRLSGPRRDRWPAQLGVARWRVPPGRHPRR